MTMVAKPKPTKVVVAKPTAAKVRAPAAKKAADNAPAAPKVIAKADTVATPPQGVTRVATDKAPANDGGLKKKALIEKVVATTGAKKALVREIIEATLNVLGDALSKGTMLNLPPFGKAKVSRASEAGSGKAMTVKLRRGPGNGAGGAKAKLALADAED